tara:strand:+ start:623 stop:919 length:297 start_codon:yes stop_codon:yes gene_type:complete
LISPYVSINKTNIYVNIEINNVFSKEGVEKNLTKLLYNPNKNDIKANDDETIARKNKSLKRFADVWVALNKIKEKKTTKKSKIACNRIFINLGRFTNF